MEDFETKEINDFLEVDKPDSTTASNEAEEDETVSSTAPDEPPKETSPVLDFESAENSQEPDAEETTDESPREDEKPATEDCGSPKGKLYFCLTKPF